jgi:CDGSH-type Zn-finger protein/uncharacterized Fe-S cluster protein YjdI
MAAHEPRIRIETREELIYLLAEAAAIEHNLMCCYLYAAWSLKRGEEDGLSPAEAKAVRGWKSAIIRVAVEEMAHLTLVSNLTSAVGGSPHFSRPNFPIAPGYHPAGVVVELARFSHAVLDHFIYLERPEGTNVPDSPEFVHSANYIRRIRAGCLMPSAQDYETVGHLYRGVRHGLTKLSHGLGEKALFCGEPESQIHASDASLPGICVVTDLRSADKAIDTIIEQGEGSPGHNEDSHYNRFIAIRREFEALSAANPNFEPAFPVAHNPVMRRPVFDVAHRVWVDSPEAANVLDLANAVYGHMLRCLVQAFGRGPEEVAVKSMFVGTGIDLMFVLAPLAEHLASLPASAAHPGINAGMTFSTLRDVAKLPHGPGEKRIMAERLHEMSEHAALLFPAPHALAGLKETLAALATRIEAAPLPGEIARPAAAVEKPSQPPASSAADTPASPAFTVTAPTGGETFLPALPSDGPKRTDKVEVAEGKDLTVRFRGHRCIHARHCVLDAPAVFKANTPGDWIFPDEMPAESLVDVLLTCPSGALTFKRKDGGREEQAPPVNQARLRENGPYAFHAALTVAGEPCGYRATLCRCGASRNKPYCDGSHHEIGFQATGEPETRNVTPLAARDGTLDVSPQKNGPLVVSGNLEIISGTGRTVDRVTRVRLCRCGHSSTKPICDNTHLKIGFEAP